MHAFTVFALLAIPFVVATPLGTSSSENLIVRDSVVVPKSAKDVVTRAPSGEIAICQDECLTSEPVCPANFTPELIDGGECWTCCTFD